MIKGITVQLTTKVQTGTDSFNRPVYTYSSVNVDNVLVGEPQTSEITDTLTLTGKKLEYVLAIPKGDNHDWEDTKVTFFGQTFITIGKPTQGIDDMIPGEWNKKVRVALYE